VYFVGHAPQDLVDWLRAEHIETRRVATVVEGSPHCNKIAPFFDRARPIARLSATQICFRSITSMRHPPTITASPTYLPSDSSATGRARLQTGHCSMRGLWRNASAHQQRL
jgi:hypothetical protein